MNRTRIVFFGIMVICLAILVASLAGRLIDAGLLLQVYIACTIFAVGVVALDFVGLLDHGGTSGHDFGTLGHQGGEAFDSPAGGHAAGHGDVPISSQAETAGSAHAPSYESAGHNGTSHAAQDQAYRVAESQNAGTVLSVLAYLRLAVYFCLGFGPVGWAALAFGRPPLTSLAIAVPFGVVAVFLARAFFSFQRKDTGIVAPEAALIGERGTVLVQLDAANMGRVRIQAGMNVMDVYARAADAGHIYQRGEEVRVVRVTDDCAFVR
jgi:membrane protein implicated in regulation of membrane protease activity